MFAQELRPFDTSRSMPLYQSPYRLGNDMARDLTLDGAGSVEKYISNSWQQSEKVRRVAIYITRLSPFELFGIIDACCSTLNKA